MKVPIEKILKKGVKLKAKKLDENDPKVKTLLDETLEEQKRILDLLKLLVLFMINSPLYKL